MIDQRLSIGKNVCIAIRDTPNDEDNPWSAQQIHGLLSNHYRREIDEGRVTIIVIPDIESVNYGRGVGYEIIEHIPPDDIRAVSATKLREEMKNASNEREDIQTDQTER